MANCRFCNTELKHEFVDLGLSPVSNHFVEESQRQAPEVFYPLKAMVCDHCHLVQLAQVDEIETAEAHFNGDYIYFSSYSAAWVEHARLYTEKMISERKLDKSNFVVELASNDGYLLQHFVKEGVKVLGIEPSANVADAARQRGVDTLTEFFGRDTAAMVAEKHGKADVMAANNVLAHVPDIDDFMGGIKTLLADNGCATIEFPWLVNLIEKNQFDTIYHEHYSYLSLEFLNRLVKKNGLEVFDIDVLNTHGGSLRVYLKHESNTQDVVTPEVQKIVDQEKALGLDSVRGYQDYKQKVSDVKMALLKFLIAQKEAGKTVVGYGAPAKGNTLLNFCGVSPDLLAYTVDRSEAKQGKLLPGTRIPVKAPEAIMETKPDYVLILPWNLKDEITEQMSAIREWGGQFAVPIPKLEVIS